MSLYPVLALMPDGPDRKFALVDAKRRLRLTELNVGPPQLLGIPVGDVSAQQVSAFAVPGPVIPFRSR